MICRYFLLFIWLLFQFVDGFPCLAKLFGLMQSHPLVWVFFFFFFWLLLPLLFYFYSIFWLLWVFVAAHGFSSSCSEQGLLSVCGAQASPCGGFSCSGAKVLGRAGFSSCVHRLSCTTACGIFPDQELNPCPLHSKTFCLPWAYQGSPCCLCF